MHVPPVLLSLHRARIPPATRWFPRAIAAGCLALATAGGAVDERRVTTGPWGTLESYEIALEVPASHLWSELFDERSYWNFADRSREQVRELFWEFGFSEELVRLLDETGTWTQGEAGLEVEFDDRVVESVTPENRSALARWMQRHNDEYFTRLHINIEGHTTDRIRERLDPRIVELVESISFHRGRVLSIIDLPYLLRQLGDDRRAKVELMRTLFTTHGLVARLKIDEFTDLGSVIDYWTAGGLNPNAASIISGAAAVEGAEEVDIVHLLPPLPRKYLFGYTHTSDLHPGESPDCFWTCMQFFNVRPSPRMLDTLPMEHFLSNGFEEVEVEPRFGDLVCLFRPDGKTFVHSYIHIAGDILYSKNGLSFTRPCLLTRRERMMSVYEEGGEFVTRVYRKRRNR